MNRKKITLWAETGALLVFIAAHALAQTFSAAIGGRVTDTSGAAVSGAGVIVQTAGAKIVRTVTAEADGRFTVGGLAPGELRRRTESGEHSPRSAAQRAGVGSVRVLTKLRKTLFDALNQREPQ